MKTERKAVRFLRPGDQVFEGFGSGRRGPVRIVSAAPAPKSKAGLWVVTYKLPRMRLAKIKGMDPDALVDVKVRHERRPFPAGSVFETVANGRQTLMRDAGRAPDGERVYRMVHLPERMKSRETVRESELAALLRSGAYRLVQL